MGLAFPQGLRAGASMELARCLDGIESFYSLVDRYFSSRITDLNYFLLSDCTQLEYVGQALWMQYNIYISKYRELTGGVIRSTSDETFLIFAQCGRALLETAATHRYYNDKIRDIASNANFDDVFDTTDILLLVEQVDKQLRGGRLDWIAYWSTPWRAMAERLSATNHSSTTRDDESPIPRQVNVQTAISHWAKEATWVPVAYAYYCDLVHPNIGSNFLMVGASDEAIRAGGGVPKNIGASFVAEGIKLLTPAIKEVAKQLGISIKYANSFKPDRSTGAPAA